MTAQNSANKSVFYKFLPYYLNKVKYLRPQLIMSIIFSVLSYPAFMLIINILCPVERELLELSQYISDPTPEQYEMNMALLDKRSLLYSLLIAEIVIGVLSLVGLFIFTFVTTLRSFRCLHNKSVVDMDMSLPINHNTRFFGDLAAVFTVNILPHFIAILLAQILLQFADLSAFDTQGETQASPASTRRGKSGEYQNVIFGKQAKPAEAGEGGDPEGQQRSSDAGSDNKPDASTTSNTLEAKRRAFQDLVNGEYKDIYTEETQRIIDRRFRETRNLEQQVGQYQPVIDMLMQRYQIGDGDMGKLSQAIENDDAYWSEAAEEAGMSVEQYKQFQKLQRENEALLRQQRQRQNDQRAQQQLQQWYGEAEQVKGLYPSFDLNAEVKNPQFLSMLRAGVPVQHAYEVVHMDQIKAGVAAMQAKATEKQVVDGIRAKGARPQENGTTSQGAFIVKDDVSKLSKRDRAEIIRRAARGEHIEF